MMENDARRQTARPRGKSGRSGNNRTAHRRGQTKGKISCHGGKLAKGAMEHPRRRGFAGKEPTLPSWQAPMTKDRRGNWAVNQMPSTSRRASSKVRGACPKAAEHSHLGRRLGEAFY
jgi:hypothetical protein